MNHILEEKSVVSGFKLTRKTNIEEVDGIMYELAHEKCGARLIWLCTEDDNKLFSATFKTVPDNNTGVFHILEHSVLCGSDKYPVKEPFVELIKSSMNTFLNAMTFPDKTMYPVSSRNEKDFLNLTEVYLDAVFKPAIYHKPEIFYQEGWHHEYDEDGKITESGVVYNEMKGVESSVYGRIEKEMTSLLFPDTTYSFVSGGYSPEIHELSYEDFVGYHKKFYSPDNAVFYLEGDLDIEKVTDLIEEYMTSDGTTDRSCTEIPMQSPIESVEKAVYYPIDDNESTDERTYILFGKVLGTYNDIARNAAASLLSDYLAGTAESPLIKRIIEEGLGHDVNFSIESHCQQPYATLMIANSERGNLKAVKKVIHEVRDEILKNGIDREELEASINHAEFRSKEPAEPRALYHCMSVFTTYLYGGNPEDSLCFGRLFNDLREKLDTNYYEELLEELLSDNACATLIMVPKKYQAEKERRYFDGLIAERVAKFTDEEKKEIDIKFEKLKAWQGTPDTPENLSKMPTLSISDVEKKPEDIITLEKECCGAKVLVHPVAVSALAYISLYFPVPAELEGKISTVGLITDVIGSVPTTRHSVTELNREIKKYMGELRFDFVTASEVDDNDSCNLYLAVYASTLKANAEKAIDLILEVINESIIDTPHIVKSSVIQDFECVRETVLEDGHRIGMRGSLAPFSVRGSIREDLEGFSVYKTLKDLCDGIDDKVPGFIKELTEFKEKIFTNNQLIIGLAVSKTDSESDALFKDYCIDKLISNINDNGKKEITFSNKKSKKGSYHISVPSSVAYACMGTTLSKFGSYSGSIAVCANIVTYEYLWNEVRVRGGAYGVGMNASIQNNELFFYSYRDPKAKNSYEVYGRTADFLRAFANSDADIDKFIISTIAAKSPLMTPKAYGRQGDIAYLSGITYEDKCRLREQMLSTDKAAVLEVADLLEKLSDSYERCVVAGEIDFSVDKKETL